MEQEQPQQSCGVGGHSQAAQPFQPTRDADTKLRKPLLWPLGSFPHCLAQELIAHHSLPSSFHFPPISPHQFPIYLLF